MTWSELNLVYYPRICLVSLKKRTKSLCEKSRSADRAVKAGPPEFERVPSRLSASEECNRCIIFCMSVTVWLNVCNDISQFSSPITLHTTVRLFCDVCLSIILPKFSWLQHKYTLHKKINAEI
jgi:hypothetical protein